MADLLHKVQASFNVAEYCDVTLYLKSGNVIPCHGLILSLSSEYFRACLRKEWSKDSEVKTVECSDFEDEILTAVIRFMYGTDCPLSEDNVDTFLTCAVFYGVDELCSKCDDYLIAHLSVFNVFKYLKEASTNARIELSNCCYDFIDNNFGKSVSVTEDFCTLSEELVLSIIKRMSLSVNEEFLFSIVSSYVDAQDDDEMMQRFAPYFIYTSMSLDYFVRECVSMGSVDQEVQRNALLFLSSTSDSEESSQISYNKRKVVMDTDLYVRRCCQVSDVHSWMPDPLNGDRLEIKTDRDLKLKAVEVFGVEKQSVNFSLSVHVTNTNELLDECVGRLLFGDQNNHEAILLHKHLVLKKKISHTVVLKTKSKPTYFALNCVESSEIMFFDKSTANVEFSTAVCGSSSSTEGQFYGFIFC